MRDFKKRHKDISDIDQKIISMYSKGTKERQISDTIQDIYGFKPSRLHFQRNGQKPFLLEANLSEERFSEITAISENLVSCHLWSNQGQDDALISIISDYQPSNLSQGI